MGCIWIKILTGLDYIMAAYEAYTRDEYWVKAEDGSFKAGCTDEKAKKPLEKLAQLYKEGAMIQNLQLKMHQKKKN